MSLLPKMPFPGHHGHHSGLPDNPLPFLETLSCRTQRSEGGRSSAVWLGPMAMNLQEVRTGEGTGAGVGIGRGGS
ncbi:similar to RIKEN cDNA 2410002F23, isoform CRA_a [Rattus norvegicus]|uniref:Similar to RIKEN cDNA 2410002F23, isoform CRA_a n=1 Tax=Rattus norvegicus TaxID=10116 RepID=A6JAM4_RAT|nr:similar to RIKEN cDNA 2410002F23, isoform CRA_a [Rattus norvegicus]EDM07508.1 similar to RIKEN cDNA 2410002F23, isoform CRA_a [Rattus norvegicus]EDM07509.1 similar to RIKEN cDNA 2410002F23, isoform CRA_a [Rattus norvegicus]EDM07510.1 similar to RIKEN cDNA 2410002F23, isoform CRA_a [Rattus norvegicus]